jgi:hypothetical protein
VVEVAEAIMPIMLQMAGPAVAAAQKVKLVDNLVEAHRAQVEAALAGVILEDLEALAEKVSTEAVAVAELAAQGIQEANTDGD